MYVTISFFPWSCSRVLSLLEMPSTNYKDLNHAPMPEISLVGTEKTTFAAGRGSCSSGIARGGICTCSVRLHNSGSAGVGGITAEADHLSCRGRLRCEVVASRGLSNRPFQTQARVEFGLTDPDFRPRAFEADSSSPGIRLQASRWALANIRSSLKAGGRAFSVALPRPARADFTQFMLAAEAVPQPQRRRRRRLRMRFAHRDGELPKLEWKNASAGSATATTCGNCEPAQGEPLGEIEHQLRRITDHMEAPAASVWRSQELVKRGLVFKRLNFSVGGIPLEVEYEMKIIPMRRSKIQTTTCPNCGAQVPLLRAENPVMDSAGFETTRVIATGVGPFLPASLTLMMKHS